MSEEVKIDPEHHWVIRNEKITHTDFIPIYPSILEKPYPKTIWSLSKNDTHPTIKSYHKQTYPSILEKPYPKTIWRVRTDENQNKILYHPLIPGLLPITNENGIEVVPTPDLEPTPNPNPNPEPKPEPVPEPEPETPTTPTTPEVSDNNDEDDGFKIYYNGKRVVRIWYNGKRIVRIWYNGRQIAKKKRDSK